MTTKRTIDLNKEFTGIGREMLIAMIVTLRARLAEYENGLIVKGWWCMECDIFNGEEHSPRTVCRHCGIAKHAPAYINPGPDVCGTANGE